MWMLCALSAIAFAAIAAHAPARLAAFVAGFVIAAAAVAAWGLPDAPVAGVAAVAAVAVYLWRPRHAPAAVACGGALGGLWPELLRMQGVPSLAGVAAAASILALTVWLSQARPAFAPPVLQDDALLGVLALGLVLAVLPGILEGWQSAVTLNVGGANSDRAGLPAWLVFMVVGSLAMGAAHSVWSRR
jgi:hypothetical protein